MQSSLNRASTKRSLQRLKDARWMARVRQRLQSLSWFMKGLTRQGRKSEIRNSKSETNPKSPNGQGFCDCRDGVPRAPIAGSRG